jgi:hypothetical protein
MRKRNLAPPTVVCNNHTKFSSPIINQRRSLARVTSVPFFMAVNDSEGARFAVYQFEGEGLLVAVDTPKRLIRFGQVQSVGSAPMQDISRRTGSAQKQTLACIRCAAHCWTRKSNSARTDGNSPRREANVAWTMPIKPISIFQHTEYRRGRWHHARRRECLLFVAAPHHFAIG